jgi:hypothetical protein
MRRNGAEADQLLVQDSRSDLVMATPGGWKLPVELVRDWRWRCLGEGLSATGAELWLSDGNGGGLVRLSERTDTFVERHDLRHVCGSPVLPLSASED